MPVRSPTRMRPCGSTQLVGKGMPTLDSSSVALRGTLDGVPRLRLRPTRARFSHPLLDGRGAGGPSRLACPRAQHNTEAILDAADSVAVMAVARGAGTTYGRAHLRPSAPRAALALSDRPPTSLGILPRPPVLCNLVHATLCALHLRRARAQVKMGTGTARAQQGRLREAIADFEVALRIQVARLAPMLARTRPPLPTLTRLLPRLPAAQQREAQRFDRADGSQRGRSRCSHGRRA